MQLGELIRKANTTAVCADPDTDIKGVSYDTRALRSGELFVAVKGYETDGHRHIAEAAANGAACIICEKTPDISVPYILVEDSRKALAEISAAWFGYPASKLKLIGVTGTNGKTSVTNLIKHTIEICTGQKVGLIGTNGNKIGDRELQTKHTTPESFEVQKLLDKMALEGCKYVVMEVSSHALCLSRVHGINYDVGVFTNLSPEHLDFHTTMDEYALAKSLLFMNCRKSVINIDDSYAQVMVGCAAGSIMTYALKDDTADLVGKDIKLQSDKVEFNALTTGNLSRVKLPVPGLFSVYNALASIAAVVQLGYKITDVISALQFCEGVKGRAEVVPTGRDHTVLIDYAHTPDALANIISAVRGFAQGRVITLFGCGGDRDKAKRPMMGKIAAELSDAVTVTSDNPRTEAPESIINEILSGMKEAKTPYQVIANRREAIYRTLGDLESGDVLILAGKGHETYQILGKEKIHFDEREIVADYYRQLRAEGRKQTLDEFD